MENFAQQVCDFLPDYEPSDKSNYATLLDHKSKDGRKLIITESNNKYEVKVSWPDHEGVWFRPDYTEKVKFSITVNKKRGIKALVGDITRKLLPAYNEHYPKQLQKMNDSVESYNRQFALRDFIVTEMLGDTIADHNKGSLQVRCYRYGVRKACISVDTVKLETDYLPKDVAVAVINLLKEKMPEKKQY